MSPSLLAAACAVLVLVLLVAEATDRRGLRASSKTLACGAFLAFALELGALESPSGIAIFLGLCLSTVGDLALLSRARSWFLLGLVAFLLAHVAYAAAFLTLGVSPAWTLGAGLGLTPAGLLVWRWLAPRVGSLARPVVAYILVICAMVALATGAYAASPSPDRAVLLGAAFTFWLSDLCVARDRFVSPGPANRYLGLPLYFGAQLLFGLGAAAERLGGGG